MTAPRRAWITAIRPVSVIGAAALASVALSVAPWQVVVRAPQDGASSSAPHLVPLRSAALHCPGPETEGLAGVPAVAGGTTTVYAAAAPAAALDQVMVVEGAGLMSVSATSAEQPLAQTSTRGAVVSTALAGPVAGEVAGSGSLAAGLAALQTWTRLDSDDRGLVATPCLAPTSEAWLVAGGGEPTRRERLVIANPGGNAATVDVTVFGVGGAIAAQGSSRLAVPPRGRSVVLLDAIAGGEVSPVVHVVASGGLVTAVIEDSWIDGAVGRGRDDAAPSAPPATDQVIPGVVVDGPGLLRVFVPGTSEAIVQARLLTPAGPTALPTNAVTRVPGGAVRDISLEGVTPGTYAVQLTSDHPIVAAALTHRRPDAAAPSDLAWAASTSPIVTLAGTPLPTGARSTLAVSSSGGPADVTVVLVAPDGTTKTTSVRVEADAATTTDVSGAGSVWLRTSATGVRAAITLELADPAGPLVSSVGLRSSAVAATEVPVHELRR
ncbi:MAG: DUF5719 family protein [Dermatophilaceae bacterium]